MGINELYTALTEGDKRAKENLFKALHVRFSLFVEHRVQDSSDAEEVVQEALTVIAQKLEDTAISTSFSAWAYQILEYELLHYYRSKGYRERVFIPSDELVESASSYQLEPEFKAALLDCLRQLSRTKLRHAQILSLHFQGFSTEEICGKLKLSGSNLYALLSRARTFLKDCLKLGTKS